MAVTSRSQGVLGPISLLPLRASAYEPHDMHRPGRPWTESNCWTDAFLELLHAMDLEPYAVSACAVATDFEGDQWQMFKFPPEDVRKVFGIEVHEMNPYRALDEQVADLLQLGRLMTIEVDAWFLPDTTGISYRREHKKTSIIVNEIDRGQRTLGYFHNAGYHAASGEDYDGLLRIGAHAGTTELLPYVELVDLDRLRRPGRAEQARLAHELLLDHLARRPGTNPVERLAARVRHDLRWIATTGESAFHAYAFVTVRQTGSAADLARGFCEWLAGQDHEHPGHAEALQASAARWTDLSDGAKSLQLKLARVARGRTADLDVTLDAMARHWTAAQAQLDTLVP